MLLETKRKTRRDQDPTNQKNSIPVMKKKGKNKKDGEKRKKNKKKKEEKSKSKGKQEMAKRTSAKILEGKRKGVVMKQVTDFAPEMEIQSLLRELNSPEIKEMDPQSNYVMGLRAELRHIHETTRDYHINLRHLKFRTNL